MGQLVFQATLGGQVNLVGPNTASTLNINVPAFAGTMASLASVTTNGVTYVNSSGQPTSGSAFVFDGTNVGIGTASPTAKLQVAKAGGVFGTNNLVYVDVTSSYGGVTLNSVAGQNSFFEIYQGGTTKVAEFGVDATNSLVNIGGFGTYATRFYSAGTERMRIDSSGNVGIGTSSPSAKLDVSGSMNFSASGVIGWGGSQNYFIQSDNANWLRFGTAGSERARIDSSGNLLVGTTSGNFHRFFKDSASDFAFQTANTSATTPYVQVQTFTAAAPNNATSMFLRCDDTGLTGRIQLRSNGGIANFSANNVNLSDRRAKTNFAPAKSYLDTICAIPVQTFNFIDQNMEEDGGLTLGVVAQDVQAVAPELVMESNWGTEEEPKMRLSIYQTDLQYALMKCIQEQQALITTLTDRITALEAK